MIPLIGLLLCIYLVFKGFEILQIALCCENTPLSAGIIGVVAVIASILIAGVFALLFISAGASASIPQLPTR